jgi:hypothetical protein
MSVVFLERDVFHESSSSSIRRVFSAKSLRNTMIAMLPVMITTSISNNGVAAGRGLA